MDWGEFAARLFTSEPAIVLYCSIVLFAWAWLKRKYEWETEQWEGLIATAFLAAEKSGLKLPNEKLNFAVKEFIKRYQKQWNKAPDQSIIQEAAGAFARKALELKFAPKDEGKKK